MSGPYMGRPLALPFPPVVEHMSDLADAASVSVQENTGHPLSFAPDSVADVDVFLGEIGSEAGGSDGLAELVFKLGAYVGELLVRHADGVWADPPAEMEGWPVVRLPSGYYADAIAKAFKRVDNGPEDSLVSFWAVVGPPAPGERRPWFRRR